MKCISTCDLAMIAVHPSKHCTVTGGPEPTSISTRPGSGLPARKYSEQSDQVWATPRLGKKVTVLGKYRKARGELFVWHSHSRLE